MKKIITILVLVFTLSACAGTMNLGNKVKQIEVGMSKHEVISKLGKSYDMKGAVKTPDGTLETISYYDSLYGYSYIFNFLDGDLVEWYYEPMSTPVDNEQRHHY